MSIGPREIDVMGDARYWLGRDMTVVDAVRVRNLRRDQEMTWREVAFAFFPDNRWDSNQLCGMDLHMAAMQLLGETWE